MKLRTTTCFVRLFLLIAFLFCLFAPGNVAAQQVPGSGAAAPVVPADPTTGLIALTALIGALSAATQRLVDLVRPWAFWIPAKPSPVDPTLTGAGRTEAEAKFATDTESYERRIHVLALICGIVTAFLSWPAIFALDIVKNTMPMSPSDTSSLHALTHGKPWWAVVLIGLLASSTSGPWNSITDWLKTLKKP